MKRIILLIALLAVVAAACGDDSEAAAPADTAAPVDTTIAATAAPEPTTAPTTAAAADTTTEAPVEPEAVVPGADADVDAVVEAYAVVFDSATSFEEKVPHLVQPEGLEETVAKYADTGDQFGGVSVEATAVTIQGDTAVIAYNLLFAGSPTYTDLRGDAVRTDSGWQISREMFCSLMSSARVGCPPA